jgi:D-alanyl-D-alanine carboxypeptidase/D-alanyl-D-alanine-endopeptidase (penicillin-binding protein 4)
MGEIGQERGTVLLEDGSGLGRGGLVTANASVKLLTAMSKHRYAEQFYDALPIAGIDGTLKSRFKGTFAEKNVHAKTGSLRYVNTISGYVTDRDGEKLVFSVMLNNYSAGRDGSGRVESDKVVKMIADFVGRSDR